MFAIWVIFSEPPDINNDNSRALLTGGSIPGSGVTSPVGRASSPASLGEFCIEFARDHLVSEDEGLDDLPPLLPFL